MLAPPAATGAEERAYLFETVIRPVLDFSLAQEATTAAERQRAEGIEAKVDALAKEKAPEEHKPWWRFGA